VTNVHSILYWVDKNNITGPPPANPYDDPQFSHWEIPVQNWWAQNSYKYPVTTLSEKPTATDNVHTNQNKPVVSIIEPDTKTVYASDQKIPLKISSSGIYPLQKIDIFVNNVYLESLTPPFNFSFTPNDLGSLQTDNEIKIISYDTMYNSSETDSDFKVAQ